MSINNKIRLNIFHLLLLQKVLDNTRVYVHGLEKKQDIRHTLINTHTVQYINPHTANSIAVPFPPTLYCGLASEKISLTHTYTHSQTATRTSAVSFCHTHFLSADNIISIPVLLQTSESDTTAHHHTERSIS